MNKEKQTAKATKTNERLADDYAINILDQLQNDPRFEAYINGLSEAEMLKANGLMKVRQLVPFLKIMGITTRRGTPFSDYSASRLRTRLIEIANVDICCPNQVVSSEVVLVSK